MDNPFTPRVVPFIPKLESGYKQRFYALVSSWRQNDPQGSHVHALEKEIALLDKSETVRSTQSIRYRAVLLLLRDLLSTTWSANFEYGQLVLNTFLASDLQSSPSQGLTPLAKSQLQHWMKPSRLRILAENREFITRAEQGTLANQKQPISSLLTDGKFLARKLREVISGKTPLRSVIDPEIQLVDSRLDELTGLRLLDIWRYFRYTWSSPAENTPGRSMQYLIRNKALPGHPIMGISSLDNCALAMGPRDDFLGWTAEAFVKKLSARGYTPARILQQINGYLSDGIASINTKGFRLTKKRLQEPTAEFIATLRQEAQEEKNKRRESLADDAFKSDSDEAKNLLFTKKRKDKLAGFLEARRQINEFLASKGGVRKVRQEDLPLIYPAMTVALLAQKEKHIGSSLLELNVCGAISPYNELLAGKLVALSALTPYVLDTYRERYKNRPSEIASQMLGEDVIRTPDLVYVGTTSLYSVGSSQYNRLVIPENIIDSSFAIRFKELEGRTQGHGTFHISRETTDALVDVLEKVGSQTINHEFGEGASPKLRLLGEGIRTLLKSDGNTDLGALTTHAMPRIIYAIPLISNLSEYLLGLEKRPKYYGSRNTGNEGTRRILDFWVNRWLQQRLQYSPAIDRVDQFDLSRDENRHLVGKWLLLQEHSVQEHDVNSNEGSGKTASASSGSERIRFLREFYKNASAYADSTDLDELKSIHVRTKLDDAIIDAIKHGKDCVLTGNPGDGKTHLIRIIEERIKAVNHKIEPVYDASTMSTDAIIKKWCEAKKKRIPFVIAINASILYELEQSAAKNLPKVVHEAYEQFESGIVCGPVPDYSNHGVVVFNLGLRSALDPSVVSGVINQMTDKDNFKDCRACPFNMKCGFQRHAKLIGSEIFRQRIQKVLNRVDLVGWHVTVRDVQSFFSYLVFWNHSCKNIVSESESDQYRIENLIYEEGQGNLFKAIRFVFDPAKISIPELDERLVIGDFDLSDWLPEAQEANAAVDGESLADFNRRKRGFYFFHRDGDVLLKNQNRNSIAGFEDFLSKDSKKQVKDILQRLRSFIGDKDSGDTFPIWRGFRFDISPRRMIISMGRLPRSQFTILVPQLLPMMANGFSIPQNYVVLQEKASKKCLKIDFAMFKLLEYSEQKVPIWALEENNEAKKIWRFMEDLQPMQPNEEDEKHITVCDLQRREKITVDIDIEARCYTAIGEKARVQ